jgi:RIO kinase 1
MSVSTAELPAIHPFFDEGLITDVVSTLKSGKEAAAYLCRAHPRLGAKYAVAKIYHERTRRNFANDDAYLAGRHFGSGQDTRAIMGKTRVGAPMRQAVWIGREFEVMSELERARADVPRPYASTGEAILMSYLGNGAGPAPQLQHAELTPELAQELFERLLWNVETFLACHIVHADLSAFNVLVWRERPVVIDFPQAVDARSNPNARAFLERDLLNLARGFARYGLEFEHERHAAWLWARYQHGEL